MSLRTVESTNACKPQSALPESEPCITAYPPTAELASTHYAQRIVIFQKRASVQVAELLRTWQQTAVLVNSDRMRSAIAFDLSGELLALGESGPPLRAARASRKRAWNDTCENYAD